MFYGIYMSPLGMLTVLWEESKIIKISFGKIYVQGKSAVNSNMFKKICKELDGYFYKGNRKINILVEPCGTEFQKNVWNAIELIPYGKTLSYADIAVHIGNPKAVRAVGTACGSNPIPIIIPCHRVVGKNGKLAGYAGGLEIKKKLLDLEKHNK